MLGKYNRRTVSETSGAVVGGAIVRVFVQATGAPVTLYSDPDGVTAIGTEYESGDQGEVEFFIYPGIYRITVEVDGDEVEEITYEHIVGDLAVTDASDVALSLLAIEPPAANSYLRFTAAGAVAYRTATELRTDLSINNVDNTSDANKPVSTATQTALDLKIDETEKGVANGVATLGSDGKIPNGQIPAIAITNTFSVASQAAMLALTAETGDVAVRTDLNKSFILAGTSASTLADWQELLSPTDTVQSVFGRTGVVTAQSGDYTTAQVTESGNLYHTAARVLATVLTGFSSALTGAVSATDTVLQAFGRIQNRLNALGTLANKSAVNNDDWSGTDLSLANGGTGASDAATARTNLGLGSSSSVTFARLIAQAGSTSSGSNAIRMGADVGANTVTDATTKTGFISLPHRLTAEEDFSILQAISDTSTNTIRLGGSSGGFNSATGIEFYTSANNTTTDGTLRLTVGSAAVASTLPITISGNAVYYATGTDVAVADGGTGSSTAAGARTNLGLGTAAVANLTTTLTSATAGEVVKVGDYGNGLCLPLASGDLNSYTTPGIKFIAPSTITNYPSVFGVSAAVVEVVAGSAEATAGPHSTEIRLIQRATLYTGSSTVRIAYRSYDGSSWTAWTYDYGSATSAAVARTNLGGNASSSVDGFMSAADKSKLDGVVGTEWVRIVYDASVLMSSLTSSSGITATINANTDVNNLSINLAFTSSRRRPPSSFMLYVWDSVNSNYVLVTRDLYAPPSDSTPVRLTTGGSAISDMNTFTMNGMSLTGVKLAPHLYASTHAFLILGD